MNEKPHLSLDTVVELIPSRIATVEAVGEFAYKHALSRTPDGSFDAELIPEIDNPYDPNAISVRHHGETIAYIPRDETHRYWQAVAKVTASGAVPMIKGRKYNNADGYPEVKLYLPEGDRSLPSEYQNMPDVDPSQLSGFYRRRTPVFQRRDQLGPTLGCIGCGVILFVLLLITIL